MKKGIKNRKRAVLVKKFVDGKYLIIMVLPVLIYFLLFHYLPMWGVLIAFKQYYPFKGFSGSSWVGLKHFISFFENPFAFRLIKNTFLLSFYLLIWSFPMPILFALILNETESPRFKKLVQTVSYMPHFFSTVVVVSLFTMFLSPSTGPINNLIEMMGYKKINFLQEAQWFRTVYISSEIWQNMGWGAIIYLAALTNVDPQLYEASYIDGAGKFKRLIYITLPSIAPTIMTMLLLRLGHVMSVGFERAFLFQTEVTYSTSDVISTFVYRKGIRESNMSYASAVGLFNSVINVIFLIGANSVARKVNETSLW